MTGLILIVSFVGYAIWVELGRIPNALNNINNTLNTPKNSNEKI